MLLGQLAVCKQLLKKRTKKLKSKPSCSKTEKSSVGESFIHGRHGEGKMEIEIKQHEQNGLILKFVL